MGLANNVPVFLTTDSGWNNTQCKEINTIVRTIRNAFIDKALQKQLPKPDIVRISKSKYGRVLNLKDYRYSDYISISFILNPIGMESGIDYPLLELEENIKGIEFQGCHSSSNPNKFLTSLGFIKCLKKDDKYLLYFHCTSNEWPVDENNNRVYFSVYVGARV